MKRGTPPAPLASLLGNAKVWELAELAGLTIDGVVALVFRKRGLPSIPASTMARPTVGERFGAARLEAVTPWVADGSKLRAAFDDAPQPAQAAFLAWVQRGAELMLPSGATPTRQDVVDAALHVVIVKAAQEEGTITGTAAAMNTSRRALRDTMRRLGIYEPPKSFGRRPARA